MNSNFKAHPWHGISPGKDAPECLTAFIEIVPSDTMKYEIDKMSGYLKVDRPQKFSNVVPCSYGFIPRTYCNTGIASLAAKTVPGVKDGDKDPLDICVFSERQIAHGNVLLQATPIGGLRLIDKGEADDKIIAVLKGDAVYHWNDLKDVPTSLLDRLVHYFLTYKNLPGDTASCRVAGIYGKKEALEVIRTAMEDWKQVFAK
ncbi:MAG: inorganic pyrophosphatase [Bacteroidia bacterium]|nr:inorganic pyrophosphatase [Bacteroidia bacterium]